MQIFSEMFSLPFWLQGLILGERCGHHALDTRKMLRRKDRAQSHYYCERVAAGWRLLCEMNKYWGVKQCPFVWLAYLDSPWSLPQQKLFLKTVVTHWALMACKTQVTHMLSNQGSSWRHGHIRRRASFRLLLLQWWCEFIQSISSSMNTNDISVGMI